MPHNYVANFPASRLTSTFVWNVKNHTSEFYASVSNSDMETSKSTSGLWVELVCEDGIRT